MCSTGISLRYFPWLSVITFLHNSQNVYWELLIYETEFDFQYYDCRSQIYLQSRDTDEKYICESQPLFHPISFCQPTNNFTL